MPLVRTFFLHFWLRSQSRSCQSAPLAALNLPFEMYSQLLNGSTSSNWRWCFNLTLQLPDLLAPMDIQYAQWRFTMKTVVLPSCCQIISTWALNTLLKKSTTCHGSACIITQSDSWSVSRQTPLNLCAELQACSYPFVVFFYNIRQTNQLRQWKALLGRLRFTLFKG